MKTHDPLGSTQDKADMRVLYTEPPIVTGDGPLARSEGDGLDQGRPEETRTDQDRPGERPDQGRPGERRRDQTRGDQGRDQRRPGQTRGDQGRPEETRGDKGRDQTRGDQGRPGETRDKDFSQPISRARA
ncbi:unnamed protein product [Boreogadus saida]